ncbi:MAG TPA: alpha/beta hydrolase family protein [Chthoniobacteraceae bacterium]|nr:alpha/beta hydrolase family protein [Chthoniobacteraceae bacterium]
MKLLPTISFLTAIVAAAQSPESVDSRLSPLKDLDGYFPWSPSPTREAWDSRASDVRKQMQVSLGLHPWPTKTPLNAVIHGRTEAEDYTVEKAFFESMPGFYVTGSLYRPRNQKGPFPAVLCPHGHWPEGRHGFLGNEELKKELANGEERFERGGRSRFQSLGVQLARLGCVAFIVDMIGYADSQQISFDLAHKFAKQRPEMISSVPGEWGLYSPQAESHGQSIMGLQTWGNIRALDFLTALKDVDPNRIGCTGGSGGGTQTMILGALDPRVTAAVPAVMVSTAMQGGCTCENACGLRIGTGNIEFAALFAPKPMAMTSAKDWTIDMPTKGYPDLEKHWAMLGKPKNVHLFHHPEFGHNYNIVTREHIYGWFNEHLRLGLPPERLKERDFEPLTKEQLTVWDAEHPAPPSGPELEKRVLKWWFDDAKAQMEKDAGIFRSIAEPGVLVALKNGHRKAVMQNGADERGAAGNAFYANSRITLATAEPTRLVSGVLRQTGETPSSVIAVVLRRNSADAPHPVIPDLRKAEMDVLELDLFLQPKDADAPNRVVKNPRESAAYTYGYNDPLVIQRAQDVITVLTSLRSISVGTKRLVLVAPDPATAPIAALASAAADQMVLDGVLINTGGFRFQEVKDIRDSRFLPLITKFGDVPGLLALAAPRKILLMGEGPSLPGIAEAAYEVAGVPDTVRVLEKPDWSAAATWDESFVRQP